jgi:putative FmdB family regulatory protein
VPLYEYQCDACGRRFEVIQKFSDAPVDVCRECGKGPVHRLLSSPAIQFKGSGWYITDYAKKGAGDSSTSGGKTGSGPSDAGKSDATKSDSSAASAKTDNAGGDSAKSSGATASKSKE